MVYPRFSDLSPQTGVSRNNKIIYESWETMLVATLRSGRTISLAAGRLSREDLLRLRDTDPFYCPVCRSPVQLKLGTKRKWHFSHHPKHPCLIESEPESVRHLSGKRQLYLWAVRNGHSAMLEHYLPEIRQRPDIFLPGIQPEAIEYQCSSIAEKVWLDRTAGYVRQGIRPVWILGGNRRKSHGDVYQLSGFESLTIRSCPETTAVCHPFTSPYFVCYYFPVEKRVCFAGNLHPVSKTLFISEEMNCSITDVMPFQLLLPPLRFSPLSFKKNWNLLKRRRRLYPSPHVAKEEYWLRLQVYRLRQNFSYFPACVGLPHEVYMHLTVSPFLWQMWIYLIMAVYGCGQWFTAERLIEHTVSRKGELLFTKRHLPLCAERPLSVIIETYLNQLVRLRVAEKKGDAYHLFYQRFHPAASVEQLLREDRLILDRLEETYGM